MQRTECNTEFNILLRFYFYQFQLLLAATTSCHCRSYALCYALIYNCNNFYAAPLVINES